jgi:hypothetical protein
MGGDAMKTELAAVPMETSVESAGVLKQRADSLRRMAGSMNELVAQAYRRRAAELELQAWLTELGAGQAHGPVAA